MVSNVYDMTQDKGFEKDCKGLEKPNRHLADFDTNLNSYCCIRIP